MANQLENDSNVIGYKPKLEYTKERTATGEIIEGEEEEVVDLEADESLYSKTLNGFAENLPSNVIDDIHYVLNNIKRLKGNLAKRFNEEQAVLQNPYYNVNNENISSSSSGIQGRNGITSGLTDSEIILNNSNTGRSYNPYNDINTLIDAGQAHDTSYTSSFEEQYDTVHGSVIPALINQLTDIENKLISLEDSFKQIYYNDPKITLDDAKSSDKSYVSELKLRERKNDTAGINYMALHYDSLLNKTISINTFKDNKKAIKVAKVIDSQEEVQATINDMDIINKLFDDIQEQLDLRSRGVMRQNDLDLIQKSLYNYYEKRKYLNDLYTLRQKDKGSKFLGRKVDIYAQNLEESIKEVNKVLMYNQNNIDKITTLEKEKYNVQKIYRSTSSNM